MSKAQNKKGRVVIIVYAVCMISTTHFERVMCQISSINIDNWRGQGKRDRLGWSIFKGVSQN